MALCPFARLEAVCPDSTQLADYGYLPAINRLYAPGPVLLARMKLDIGGHGRELMMRRLYSLFGAILYLTALPESSIAQTMLDDLGNRYYVGTFSGTRVFDTAP